MLAAVLAGGITFLFWKRLGANKPHTAAQIVVATTDLPVGLTLSAKDVMLLDWYSEALPSGAFTKTDAVVGHPLLFPLSAKEPVLQRDLGVEGAGIGLASKIPEGMRAVAVRSDEIVGVAGFLYPGSRVDLLVTFNPPGENLAEAVTVLQNVEVLTAGQTIEPDPTGKPQTVNVVTLLLTPEDSQKLQLATSAAQQGKIQFVLRSGADKKIATVQPTQLIQLAGNRPAPPPVVAAPGVMKHAPRKPAAPPTPIYVMEVIQGTQRSVQKF